MEIISHPSSGPLIFILRFLVDCSLFFFISLDLLFILLARWLWVSWLSFRLSILASSGKMRLKILVPGWVKSFFWERNLVLEILNFHALLKGLWLNLFLSKVKAFVRFPLFHKILRLLFRNPPSCWIWLSYENILIFVFLKRLIILSPSTHRFIFLLLS